MLNIITLIDKAAKVCGSQNALAKQLGFSKGTLSDMRHGRKAISPATAAELADIAGEDARQAAIDAVIEGAVGTRREGVLREILGKGLAAGVVGLLAISYSADSSNATAQTANTPRAVNWLYIVSSWLDRLILRYRQPTSPACFAALQSRQAIA